MPVPVLFPGRGATRATSRPGDSRRGMANSTGRVRASRGAVATSAEV